MNRSKATRSSKCRNVLLAGLLFALVCGAGVAPPSSAQRRKTIAAAPGTVVFAVTKGVDAEHALIDPIVVISSDGRYVMPVSGESGQSDLTRFAAAQYSAGRAYRVLSGGGEAGSLTIKEASAGECQPAAATAVLQTTAKIGGNVMALATDSATLGRTPSSRRAPDSEERAAAIALAEKIYKRKGVGADALQRDLTVINLTATDLDRDNKSELIGSFVVKTGRDTRDTLFLIAEKQGRDYGIGLEKYERIKAGEMMDGSAIDSVGASGLLTELFIDQLDVDNRDTAEVFTVSMSFEGTHYAIYRKQLGRWRGVYQFYSYRCGY